MNTHGHYKGGDRSPTHKSWGSMIARCLVPSTNGFRNYGGRGIKVCDRWLVFENFLADMGDRPEGKTLDREDVNGDYTPDNCRWATVLEQSGNRRSNRMWEAFGLLKTVPQWAREYGINESTLGARVRKHGIPTTRHVTRAVQS